MKMGDPMRAKMPGELIVSDKDLGFRPLYRQVRDLLVRRIADGIWQAGQPLPSESEIALDLGVSQGTVRKALDEMTAENLVVRRQGRGTYVARHDDARILFQFFKLVPDTGERSFPESRMLETVIGAYRKRRPFSGSRFANRSCGSTGSARSAGTPAFSSGSTFRHRSFGASRRGRCRTTSTSSTRWSTA